MEIIPAIIFLIFLIALVWFMSETNRRLSIREIDNEYREKELYDLQSHFYNLLDYLDLETEKGEERIVKKKITASIEKGNYKWSKKDARFVPVEKKVKKRKVGRPHKQK